MGTIQQMHEDYLRAQEQLGDVILLITCPCCTMASRVAAAANGQVRESLTICPQCEEIFYQHVSLSATYGRLAKEACRIVRSEDDGGLISVALPNGREVAWRSGPLTDEQVWNGLSA